MASAMAGSASARGATMPGACSCSGRGVVAVVAPSPRWRQRPRPQLWEPRVAARINATQRPGSGGGGSGGGGSGGGGSGGDDLGQKAQELFGRAAQQAGEFVREQQLDKKAAAAYADASEQLRTSFARIDAEYDLGRKLGSFQSRVGEAARDADQKLSLRRRARALIADTQRLAPIWLRRGREFGETTAGKATYTLAFVALLLSGALFKFLNLLWLGWWVAVPLSLVAAEQRRRKEREAAAAAASSARSGFWGGGGGGSGSGSGAGGGSRWDTSGPIVDAEWVSLDDDGQPSRGGKK